MSRRPTSIRLTPYTATARRSRSVSGTTKTTEWYWTVRCRRKGMEGEWKLGWFTSRRQAETALSKWVAERTGRRHRRGSPTMVEVISEYEVAVGRMQSKRKATRWNRRYTAKQLRAFLAGHYPDLLADHFDEAKFEEYLGWLRGQDYSPQTIENALIGARTIFKWAHASKLIAEPPRRPRHRVPPTEKRKVARAELDAVLQAAEGTDEPERLGLLLRVLWETGMRPSEAIAFRRADVLASDAMIRVAAHGDYQPKTQYSHRLVPISRSLCDELRALDLRHDPPFDVPHVDRPYHYWRHRLQIAIRAAEVDDFTLGDLRNSRSTRLLEAATPLHVYGRMMGHSPKTALKHYAAVSDSDLRAAFERARPSDDEDGGEQK